MYIYIYTRKKKEEEKTHNKNKTTANQLHLNCTEYLINSFFACIAFPASSERRWGGGGGGNRECVGLTRLESVLCIKEFPFSLVKNKGF